VTRLRKNRELATRPRGVARVLLADDNPTSRLTLQTILEAGGYRVDSAASAVEACGLLDKSEYALVLTYLSMESPQAGLRVLAHARGMEYRPATALVTASQLTARWKTGANEVLIEPEDLPDLLVKVAGLVSSRASRQVARTMRQAS
jgi:CheY-like chemotaxis protein